MTSVKDYAVILDRDNTINFDPGYLSDPDKTHLLPGAAEGIALLNRFGIRLFGASNQSGVARGLIRPEELIAVNQRITDLLSAAGAKIGKIYVCPHGDEDNCDCRKPKPGLIQQIISAEGIDPQKTYLVGDRARDLACGEGFGMRGIVAGDTQEAMPSNIVFRAKDLAEAAAFILEDIFERETRSHIFANVHEFLPVLTAAKGAGKRVVFTNGCFDLVHSGHVQLLSQARALGDYLVLGLNSDRSVRALKGPMRPVNSEIDRARVLVQLPYIDAVVVFDEDTPIELIRQIAPAIHVKGGDYVKEKLPEYETVRQGGGDIVILPFRKGYSTTSILSRSATK